MSRGFDGIEAANIANLSSIVERGVVGAGHRVRAAPGPRSRRQAAPAAAGSGLPGEAISRATHCGDPGGGDAFISGWSAVADAVDDAARVLTAVVDNLPATWSSHVSTPVVRTHLLSYRTALNDSGARARGLARQAGQHAADLIQARQDIPIPAGVRPAQRADTADVGGEPRQRAGSTRRRWRRSTPARWTLTRAVAGYGTYHAGHDATTAPLKDENPLPMDDPGAGPDVSTRSRRRGPCRGDR